MFEQLLSFSQPYSCRGVVIAVQGNQYLAQHFNEQGELISQAPKAFSTLSSAQEWLKKQGVKTISFRQSPAYLEMVGFDA